MRKKHTVAVIDGGGRASVLVDKYLQSGHVSQVIAIPGNDWIKHVHQRKVKIFPGVKTTDKRSILKICEQEKVDLIDVAQDNAVEAGVTDILIQSGFKVVGPTQKAGRIEWDKAWCRNFCSRLDIPQPSYKVCTSVKDGMNFINRQTNQKWFIKAAFLAEGKGALSAQNNEEAVQCIKEIRSGKFKKSGRVYLIEKWLASDNNTPGEEFSMFVVCDGGINYQILGYAQDHKRALNFDKGENTGGMGASSPPLILTKSTVKAVETKIIQKVIRGLSAANIPYKGVLYLGGILIKNSGKLTIYVIEFNARWGDPEAQIVIPGIVNDFFDVGMAVVRGTVGDLKLETDGKARVVVTGSSRGYPGDYSSVIGKEVFGLDEARKQEGVRVYGAGLKIKNGKYYVGGGRLFYVVGEGKAIIEARQRAYSAISLVHVEGNNLHYRTDIGWRDVERLGIG